MHAPVEDVEPLTCTEDTENSHDEKDQARDKPQDFAPCHVGDTCKATGEEQLKQEPLKLCVTSSAAREAAGYGKKLSRPPAFFPQFRYAWTAWLTF